MDAGAKEGVVRRVRRPGGPNRMHLSSIPSLIIFSGGMGEREKGGPHQGGMVACGFLWVTLIGGRNWEKDVDK